MLDAGFNISLSLFKVTEFDFPSLSGLRADHDYSERCVTVDSLYLRTFSVLVHSENESGNTHGSLLVTGSETSPRWKPSKVVRSEVAVLSTLQFQ